jgi:hypothetical protein
MLWTQFSQAKMTRCFVSECNGSVVVRQCPLSHGFDRRQYLANIRAGEPCLAELTGSRSIDGAHRQRELTRVWHGGHRIRWPSSMFCRHVATLGPQRTRGSAPCGGDPTSISASGLNPCRQVLLSGWPGDQVPLRHIATNAGSSPAFIPGLLRPYGVSFLEGMFETERRRMKTVCHRSTARTSLVVSELYYALNSLRSAGYKTFGKDLILWVPRCASEWTA